MGRPHYFTVLYSTTSCGKQNKCLTSYQQNKELALFSKHLTLVRQHRYTTLKQKNTGNGHLVRLLLQ